MSDYSPNGWLSELQRTAQQLNAAAERISTLEALTDQLAPAAALIAEVDDDMYPDPDPDDILWDRCQPTVQQVRDAIRAVRAYEADKEAHR